MDEFAKSWGYGLIAIALIYVVGKVIISLGEQKRTEDRLPLDIWDHERRLAFRHIWRSTQDPRVHEDIKYQYGPWALLEVELSDDEYHQRMMLGESFIPYSRARESVKNKGFAYELQNGKIISRLTKDQPTS
ncbi:MAG: hypothetical protein ACRENK_04595 [Gemmatimonadaceae bacterium]